MLTKCLKHTHIHTALLISHSHTLQLPTLTAAAVLLQSVLCVLRRLVLFCCKRCPFHVNSVVAKLNPGFAQQAVNHQTSNAQCQ